MEKKKIIILIPAEGGVADRIQAIKETWASTKLEGFEVLYLYGYRDGFDLAPGQCIQHNDELLCGINPDDIHRRYKIALDYIYDNYDFEYLLIGCCGRYIIQDKILEFIKDKPNSEFYYGTQCCIFISKDLVKIVNDNPSGCYLDHTIAPNAAFAEFFKEKGIIFKHAPTQIFNIENDILIAQSIENDIVVAEQRSLLDDLLFDNIIQYLDKNQFQYHFGWGIPRPAIMREVHQKLTLDKTFN